MITQTIGDKVYRFKHRTGLVFIASLIGGFIAKEQGAIDWSTWGIIGRSALASVIWFIFALVVFMILGIFRVKKYVKEQEEMEKARDYANSEIAKAIWNARKLAEDTNEQEKVTTKIENATEEFKKEVVQKWNDAKSIPTAELLRQIKDDIYLVEYDVYDDTGNKKIVHVTMKDKKTSKERLAICRDKQMAEIVWHIAKEKLDKEGKIYSEPAYKKLHSNMVCTFVDRIQEKNNLDEITSKINVIMDLIEKIKFNCLKLFYKYLE